jgi:6-pyruvoyltetrahydropterin/6-carboxytetrahydropterin synthase
MTTPLLLSREVRFGLHEHPLPHVATANGFAANPALVGLTPFLTLTVTAIGVPDPALGMLVNIKLIDTVVRETAIDMIRAYYPVREDERPGGDLVLHVFAKLQAALAAKSVVLDSMTLALSPYLSLGASRKELSMVCLTQHFEFSAAHRLHSPTLSEAENQQVFGRCNNPNGHGHNYELEVTVAGEPDSRGQIISLAELQKAVTTRVLDVFDHKHLNLDCAEFRDLNPTVENIARVIYEKLSPAFTGKTTLRRIRIWETPKTCCEYPA